MATQEEVKEFMLKEVDIIQEIIKRMAHNSFLIKGWTITLVVATLLLKGNKAQAFITFIPLIGLWYLDAYFLRQERLYRKLYSWVVANRHLPYEAELNAAFKRVRLVVEGGGYKLFEATK